MIISFTCREWPNPVLLKNITSPSEVGLNFPVWDPRVNMQIIYETLCSLVVLDYPTDFQRVQCILKTLLGTREDVCTVPLIRSFIL